MHGLSAKVQKYHTYTASYSGHFSGHDVARLQFEIASIQELLDEQPDSKCRFIRSQGYLLCSCCFQGAWNP